MTTNREEPAFTHVFDLTALDEGGVHIVLEPGESERRAIASRLDIPALNRLKGDFHVTPIADGAEIRLIVEAQAERQCVVSLEPMSETVREEFAIRFERSYKEDEDQAGELGDDIAREPLEGDSIDLGELLVQHLSLALDPYPRRPDADAHLEKYRDEAPASPFGVLKGLLDRDR